MLPIRANILPARRLASTAVARTAVCLARRALPLRCGVMQLSHTSVEHCGRRNLAEYCLHMHHVGDVKYRVWAGQNSHESYFIGNAVRYGVNKGITLGTHRALVQHNVITDNRGPGITSKMATSWRTSLRKNACSGQCHWQSRSDAPQQPVPTRMPPIVQRPLTRTMTSLPGSTFFPPPIMCWATVSLATTMQCMSMPKGVRRHWDWVRPRSRCERLPFRSHRGQCLSQQCRLWLVCQHHLSAEYHRTWWDERGLLQWRSGHRYHHQSVSPFRAAVQTRASMFTFTTTSSTSTTFPPGATIWAIFPCMATATLAATKPCTGRPTDVEPQVRCAKAARSIQRQRSGRA